MLVEKGKLPNGVEIDGSVCRDYELREQLVRDAVELLESDDGPRAVESDNYYSVCIMAKRLKLAGVESEKVTTAVVMDMTQVDFNELAAADKRLAEKRRTFRDAA